MAKKYNQETRELILQLNKQGQSVPSLAREYGISEATIFNWKKNILRMKKQEKVRQISIKWRKKCIVWSRKMIF
ncbi:hypothetical protein GCM10025857_53860 [Alicyclobacillus contaminans]|nr:hypothetical protein GCM10025857_53860 [Alicyclobacillus contaminans]